MKRMIIRKIVTTTLLVVIVATYCMALKPIEAKAATLQSTMTSRDNIYEASVQNGFELDEKLYFVDWYESDLVKVKQNVRSFDKHCDKGVLLGKYEYKAGLVTSKKRIDGKYYQRLVVAATMYPQSIGGDVKGMSQYLMIEADLDKAMLNRVIEPVSTSGSTQYSITGSGGIAGSLGVSKTGNAYTLDGGGQFSLGIQATTSYKQSSLNIVTNADDYNYAVWRYDYVSSSKSSEQNAYLFGSSTQYALYSWNTKVDTGKIVDGIKIYITTEFGAGNINTNKRYTPWNKPNTYVLGGDEKKTVVYYGDYYEKAE